MNKPGTNTALFTTDFRREFAQETLRLLRGRFVWFVSTLLGLGLLGILLFLVPVIIAMSRGQDWTTVFVEGPFSNVGWLSFGVVGLWYLVYILALVWVVIGRRSDQAVLQLTMWVVFLDGLINILLRVMNTELLSLGLISFGISHFIAAMFLPWTPRQALRPAIPLLILSALSRIFIESPTVFGNEEASIAARMWPDLVAILFSPLVVVPGTAVCWIRHSHRMDQYRIRFLNERYGEVRRELVDARRIHEALFPSPRTDGRVRFAYHYHPMRQIGGDFLHAIATPTARGDGDALSVVLLDVTGHGIPAALTVNRLHGELDRLFAEDPLMSPGDVLKLLNRYVHLTLAPHNVFATAICLRIDPDENSLVFASGGHPPAFLRSVDQTVEQLDSTTFILGAVGDQLFESGERRFEFQPGDTLVAYTDGATESRNEDGAMLGLAGIQRLVSSRSTSLGSWSSYVATAVDGFRDGPPLDDTLVIEVFRPFGTDASKPPAESRDAGQRVDPAPVSL